MGLATQSECSSSQLCVVWVPWRSCHPHTFRWLTVEELRREVEHETSKAAAVEQWTRLQPMPVYLLQRQPESPAGSGCVWCISGALRGLVAAEELMPSGPMLWKVSPSVFRCASTACRCALLAYIDVSEYDLFMLCCRFWRATRRSACLQRASRKCAPSVCKSLKQLARRAR